ncbi:PilZ domain-containing protein [Sphingomonas nostoxanthinifaciens]|uniref:PilZ domain-containing protein n=1 Tax=Sphingomonas nostoxanthinifaciens TaxID=2872652 RepID=UPI001CC1F26B|nr:PilZ domain-containing protein [Sphingomonas nostoxanthinifaciens]UAK24135.1 PilZ domain-containing protein [Sphingomonas nostoxanthinifaciens]
MTDGLQRLIDADAAAAELSERRQATRHTTVFQVARIISGDRDELCILRNVSPGGLKAELYMAIAPGARVVIELKTGFRLDGTAVWAREPFVGVQFDAPVAIMEMLKRCAPDVLFDRGRPPRLETELPAMLRINGIETPTRISNISQSGMKIAVPHRLGIDTRCEVRLPVLGWRRACVRWSEPDEAGLMLVQPFLYPDFVAWRRALQDDTADR